MNAIYRHGAALLTRGAFFGLLCAGAAPAAEAGECGTPEQITQRMKAEGQHSFATADRIERQNDLNILYGMIFTINDDRSFGYIIQSDKDSDVRATKLCILHKLADVRIFDARKPGLDPASLLKASDDEGRKRCDEIIKSGKLEKGTCVPFNETIKNGEPNGERIMLEGFNVEKQPDGSYKRNGTFTTVTGNMNGRLRLGSDNPTKDIVCGVFFTSLPDGATMISFTMVYAHYTPYANSLLTNEGAK